MSGRALLIGGAVEKLTGVDNDIAAMKEALENRGIAVEPEFVLSGKDATRKAVLAAYERLIDLTEHGDLAVVYYSGHGGRALPPTSLAAQPVPAPGTDTGADSDSGPGALDLQFIVPYDFNESAPGDFRGITSVELSVLQARLTQKTDNVVTIFDCCHSGHISRKQFVPKATDHVTSYEELSAHIARMMAEGLNTRLFRSAGNREAVRIVACAPEQQSFEYPGVGGKQIGVMTEALTMGLRMAGKEKISWATLLDGMRYRISALVGGQRPEAEGPSLRRVFETVDEGHLGSLPVLDLDDGRLQLNCAPLLGVRPGDTFSIVSSSEEKVGDLTVDRAGPLFAQGPVTLAAGVTRVPVGARAVRLTASAPKLVVSVLPDVQPSPQLARALKESPLVRMADADDPDDLWAAQLRIDQDGGVTIADRFGALHQPPVEGPSDPDRTVGNLERLARAEALRTVDNNSDWALDAKVTVEWGLVEEGQRRPLPNAGAVVRAGQEVYVSVRTENDAPVYVTLVDVGVTGAVTVLTDFAPPGVRLSREDRQEYVFGYEELTRTLDGVPLEWPESLAPGQARTETVLVFVTAEPQDFSALMQHGVKRKEGVPVSPLTTVIDQVAAGGNRDLSRPRSVGGRYDVRKIEFELEPASEGFLIDEKSVPQPTGALPRGSVTGLVEPGAGVPTPVGDLPIAVADIPTAVAIRLEELVIHRNRARFGGADIRVDAIVLTGTQDSPHPTFRAQTQRFSRIRDDEPLPLDRMLVFHGPVVDYLDIALWVSRDGGASRDLGELLSDEVATFEMQEALAKAGETLTGLPYAAAAAAAVGLGAVVVNLAYRLLRGSVSDVIGLYRGSRLAGEAFGVGRHPGSGTRQVQDFSLAYSIDDVS